MVDVKQSEDTNLIMGVPKKHRTVMGINDILHEKAHKSLTS